MWGICFHQTLINLVSVYVLRGEITHWDSPHNGVAIYSSMMINSPNKQLPYRLGSDNCRHATWSSGGWGSKTIFLHLGDQSGEMAFTWTYQVSKKTNLEDVKKKKRINIFEIATFPREDWHSPCILKTEINGLFHLLYRSLRSAPPNQ